MNGRPSAEQWLTPKSDEFWLQALAQDGAAGGYLEEFLRELDAASRRGFDAPPAAETVPLDLKSRRCFICREAPRANALYCEGCWERISGRRQRERER